MNIHNMTLDELTDTIDRYSGGDPAARAAGYELAARIRTLENTLKTIQEISSPKDRTDRIEPWVLLDIIDGMAYRAIHSKENR